MGVHSGKFGVVNGISTVREWMIDFKADVRPFVASNTGGGHGRVKGNTDWTGSYKTYGHTPPAMPGDAFTFEGYGAPADDTGGDSGTLYQGNAMVESIEMRWDWASAEPHGYDVSFGANGTLTQLSNGTISDGTSPDAPTPIGIHPVYTTVGGSFTPGTTLANITQATFKITSDNKQYVNSSTAGQVQRKAGVIDWTYTATVQDDDLTTSIGLVINTMYALRLPVNGSSFWALNWGIFHGLSDLRVDRETGNIIQANLNFSMAGYDLVGNTAGFIKKPDTTSWWPFTG